MKKTKNIFWVLSIFVLTLYSCSSDNDDSVKLLKKVVETSEEGTSETALFTYNGTEIVRIEGAQKRTDFTYTDGLITKIVTLSKTNQLLETNEYSYLEGKLVEVESLGNYRIKYIHNTDKTVSYQKFTIGSGNQEVKEFHGILYFENENLIKEERTLDNTAVGVTSNYSISFDYDAKNNPLYNILGYKKLLDKMETISSNNSLINTVIATTTNGDQVLSLANFYKSSFQYDSENYPAEQVSETALFANGNRGYLKTEYFY
ncbi:hypothetical protein QLS91_02230 [Flavobacterium sp. LB2P84]|uniref:hypothetical protein n=1 Tax=Flavobacterium yafengii TaxID=3041253 RepID=UPI0024A8CD43|nr:hypothetical protein [Flavobacterium yafengii]MDI6031883.1 hypothetical protein [Flavobacterium yafengii]